MSTVGNPEMLEIADDSFSRNICSIETVDGVNEVLVDANAEIRDRYRRLMQKGGDDDALTRDVQLLRQRRRMIIQRRKELEKNREARLSAVAQS